MKKYILIILAVSILAILPMVTSEYKSSHDTKFHLTNIDSLTTQIEKDFLNPSKVVGNIGNDFGYGTNLFYPPLSHYPAAYLNVVIDNPVISVEIIYLIDCECDNVCGDNGSLFFFTSKGILQAHLSKDYKDIESVRYITHKYSYGDILQGMLYIPHVTGQQSIVLKGNLKGDQLTSVICFDGEIKKIQLGLKYIFYQRTAYENVLTTDNEKVIIPYESLVVKDVTTGNETEICGYYNP